MVWIVFDIPKMVMRINNRQQLILRVRFSTKKARPRLID
jgi:hypothetical protein